jgi:hypothetical protein
LTLGEPRGGLLSSLIDGRLSMPLVELDPSWYLYRLKEGADIYPSVRLHDNHTIEI